MSLSSPSIPIGAIWALHPTACCPLSCFLSGGHLRSGRSMFLARAPEAHRRHMRAVEEVPRVWSRATSNPSQRRRICVRMWILMFVVVLNKSKYFNCCDSKILPLQSFHLIYNSTGLDFGGGIVDFETRPHNSTPWRIKEPIIKMVSIRQATADDLIQMQTSNLWCLPEK